MTREKILKARDEMPEKYQGNAAWWFDRHRDTIRNLIDAALQPEELISGLDEAIANAIVDETRKWKAVQTLACVDERMCFPVDACLKGQKPSEWMDYLSREFVEHFFRGYRDQQITQGDRVWPIFWRWIERAKWDKKLGMESCIDCLVHHPSAPWNNDRAAWDFSHKEYDAEIDRMISGFRALQNNSGVKA